MHESKKDVEAKLLSLLHINDLEDSGEAFEIIISALATICEALNDSNLRTAISNIEFPHAKALRNLPSADFTHLSRLVKAKRESLLETDIYDNQMIVQRLISPPKRKRLAAYYTKPVGLELLASLAADSMRTRRSSIILADPFLGSGLTITATLKRLDTSMVRKVWGVEPHPLPALIAYSAILYSLKGDHRRIDVSVGDVFRNAYSSLLRASATPGKRKDGETPRADIIVTNPPFTRWELLESDYRDFLWDFVERQGNTKYVTRKQLNLQVASLFLMDYLLKDNGLLISVLPASTFYTLYGEAVKNVLEEKYQVNALVESKSETSFSTDSGLKEVILFATKQKATERDKTVFVTLESGDVEYIRQIGEMLRGRGLEKDNITWANLSEKSILSDANWSVFFANTKLRETLSGILLTAMKNETIGRWSTIYGTQSIIRGVEMYGPDFFFIPNRHWNITEEHAKAVTLENAEDEVILDVPKNYLVPALRKPGLYLDTIRPDVKHYLISIPPMQIKELPEGLAKYVAWGKRKPVAQPAIRVFGDHWYSHVNKQIRVKKPFGRVFLPDKVDPTFQNRGLFASHSQTPLVASKNFHIVSLDDDSKDRMLTLWFNSTLFISYFILAGRKITKSWSRLLEDNYLKMPIVNLNSLSKRDTMELEKAFESISDRRLPPMKQQLDTDYRHRIDRTLLEAMGVEAKEDDLNRIYSALQPNLR